MKKITFSLVALLATLCATAQTKFWVYKNNGTQIECLISEVDSISFTEPITPVPAGEKCNASDYPQVTIGDQTWMAENYRCSIYDTKSEAYKEGRRIIPASVEACYTPYYSDAADKSLWSGSHYAGNLTDEQVAKLGYLYNWAAAVGVEDGTRQTTQFEDKRQGICPNGWHVPTAVEWDALRDYIEKTAGKGTKTAGKHLKTTSGWHNGGNGEDTYGFAVLPAGYAYGSSVSNVGGRTDLWTATSDENGGNYAYVRYFDYDYDFFSDYSNNKCDGLSLRCLRN